MGPPLFRLSLRGYTPRVRIEWDGEKNEVNIRKHGLSFADASEMFGLPLLVAPDRREDYGEDRFVGIGFLK